VDAKYSLQQDCANYGVRQVLEQEHRELSDRNNELMNALQSREMEKASLRQFLPAADQMSHQLHQAVALREQLEQQLASQTACREGLEMYAMSQDQAMGQIAHELHFTQGALYSTGHALVIQSVCWDCAVLTVCVQANEQRSADRLADGFVEMAGRAAGEQLGRQQAEQVLSQAVSGTIQWLDQVATLCIRNSISVLND